MKMHSAQSPAKRPVVAAMQKWVPVIVDERCTGCGLCVDACGPACLELVNTLPVLVRPDQCGSEEHCIAPCPENAIHMEWVPMDGNRAVGRWLPTAGRKEELVT